MQIVENLLKAIDRGEYKINGLGLPPEELGRYYGCLLMARILTSTHTGSEGGRLSPAARGNALLNLIRDLDKISEEDVPVAEEGGFEESVDIPGWFLETYALEKADINRIQTRLVN
jgi:hypothetical protein